MATCRTMPTMAAAPTSALTATPTLFFPPTLLTLPKEVLENIAFHHICPHLLGPPVSLTSLLLVSKSLYRNLTNSKHLYARVFKYKFSFSAIRRRSFEPSSGEWTAQLQTYCKVLRSVRRRRQRPAEEQFFDEVCDDIGKEEPLVEDILFTLWLMCLEDDGCNRLQMQISGVYEWVEGYIQIEMYKVLNKGWPIPNAANSSAMFILWYLCSKDRLLEEPADLRESIIDKVLPFLTVPFRYPTAFAPVHHFRLPFKSSTSGSAAYHSFSEPTTTAHGPFPIYLLPRAHHWDVVHFARRTPLCTPLAADSAKLVYFTRRETMLFSIPPNVLRNRTEHRERLRYELAMMNGVRIQEISDREVEVALQSELPLVTAEDYMELNEGLLGGVLVDSVVPSPTQSAAAPVRPSDAATPPPPSPSSSKSKPKGGGTALPFPYDAWDTIRKEVPSFLDPSTVSSFSDLEAAESILLRFGGPKGCCIDESTCRSKRWDEDWWRLRLCRSCWSDGEGPDSALGESGGGNDEVDGEEGETEGGGNLEAEAAEAEAAELDVVPAVVAGDGNEEQEGTNEMVVDSIVPEASGDHERGFGSLDGPRTREAIDNDADNDNDAEIDADTVRSPAFLTGYPQKGALYTPGMLDGLWTGRMVIPSEPHLRALLLTPEVQQGLLGPFDPVNAQPENGIGAAGVDGGADGGAAAVPAVPAAIDDVAVPAAAADAANADPNAIVEAAANAIVNATQTEAGHRPEVFTEDTLGLVAVPLYVRFKEYVVYNGGKVLPCAADTEEEGDDLAGLGLAPSLSSAGGSGSGAAHASSLTPLTVNVGSQSQPGDADDGFNQEKSNAWYPQFSALDTKGDRLTVTVPSQSLPPRSSSRKRNGGGQEKFDYVAVNSKSKGVSGGRGDLRGGDEAGMFHDEETCAGCRTREEALRAARARDEAEAQAEFRIDSAAPSEGSSSSSSASYTNAETEMEPEEDPYVPSPTTIPPCNGIRDVLITGTTDTRHAEAWRRWAWKGRVRKWDGMIGLIREPVEGPLDGVGGGEGGGGKILFYGTLLGGKNFVGTWRLANQDPRMPAYEGAFTLGRKEEDE